MNGESVCVRANFFNGIKRLIFFSSVAVYGLNKPNPKEDYNPKEPFNHYGISKLRAEHVADVWADKHPDWNINIVRPTVIFGSLPRICRIGWV